PDILLTNYKMLDYLLLRRDDRDLWATNSPETLRYLVLDEFHTYDGAQGSDVAMLLRRLGTTLKMARPDRPLGDAVPVATSATLGSGRDAREQLCEFAEKVFGTRFDEDSIIGESRQTVEESCKRPNFNLPTPSVQEVVDTADLGSPSDQLEALAVAFCKEIDQADFDFGEGWEVRLGDRLLAHPMTRAVLAAVGDKSRPWHDAVEEIVLRERDWGRVAMTDPDSVGRALERFLWLLSVARRRVGSRTAPLFAVEVQLWVREVSRLLRTVTVEPAFRWSDSAAVSDEDDFLPPALGSELPSVYCRRCGLSGWMVTQSELDNRFNVRPGVIYSASIERPAVTRALLRANPEDPVAHWYSPGERRIVSEPGEDTVPVIATPDEDSARSQKCPACDERDAIRFLGLRVASLASVSINTLFGSVHVEDDERKLLAFTDSVQDASHRASFFSGRTHRINLRSLMSRLLKDEEGGHLTLETLGAELLHSAETPRDRYGLIPPDLLRDPSLKSLLTDNPEAEALELLKQRLTFEAAIEFGLRSRVGRTLELSSAVAAHVHLPERDQIGSLVVEHIGQNTNPTLFPDPDRLERNIDTYVRGVVERLRLRGAIVHPLLEPYLANDGRLWFVWGGRPHGLPPFTPGQGRPTFATTSSKGDFDSLIALSQTPTWWVDWGERVLGVDRRTAQMAADFLVRLMGRDSPAVVEVKGKSSSSYGLSPEFVHVYDQPSDSEPAGVRCTICGNRHAVPHHMVDRWAGATCLRYRCTGSYEPDPQREQNYYRKLYRSGITRRVVTAEHTGILGRADREDLETAFRDGTAPDAPNVVTATPTLEMGIDIGDLSAVMLTSVPPTPANYIQRVGRAGRSTGNALITTFVPTDTHGLYYLAQPEAMLAGDVRAPSCHLNAKDTLERQFFAFVLDRIADLTLDVEPLGREIQHVFTKRLDEGSTLRQVVDAARLDRDHIEAFIERFGTQLDPSTIDHLRSFADEGMERRTKTVLDDWHGELRDLNNRRDRLNGRINKLKEQPALSPAEEDELRSLHGQRQLIIQKMRNMRSEYVLNALQRYGLTPNYTLVDDSATLEANLWSRDENGEYQAEIVEYTRSASLGLREFAPGNSFYAVGHRHVVDAIDVGAADVSTVETWQLCPECGF
ncbi:MAG: helicase, partial [Actinomycetia bacterium]|nr:helicase [Actinomycetes bacterium]